MTLSAKLGERVYEFEEMLDKEKIEFTIDLFTVASLFVTLLLVPQLFVV